MPPLPGFKDEFAVGNRTILDFVPSTEKAIKDAAAEALVRSPLSSLQRIQELDVARSGRLFVGDPSVGVLTEIEVPTGRTIGQEEANEIGKPFGLTFDRSVTEREMDILIERKRKETARSLTLTRTRGFAQKSAVFSAELLSTIADPLNIASAFIPVVGPARYASMLNRFGKTGARLAKGASEGFVGALAAETVVIHASDQEQADYDLNDSVMNIMFGTVLGGGLHAGLGKVGDVLSARRLNLAEGRATRALDEADVDIEARLRDRLPAEKIDDMTPSERAATLRNLAGQVEEGLKVNADDAIPNPRRPLGEQAEALRQRMGDVTQADSYDPEVYPRLREEGQSSTHEASVKDAEELTEQVSQELQEQADDILETITKFDDDNTPSGAEVGGESRTLQRELGIDSTGRLTELENLSRQTDELSKLMDDSKSMNALLNCIRGAL